MRYCSPTALMTSLFQTTGILVISNSWEESLESAGSRWGGEDKNDADYGL